MPLFVLLGWDGDGAATLRPEIRPAHLEHWKPLDAEGRVRFGGPLLGADGRPRGSLLVFEAPDLESAKAHAAQDPYVRGGVFGRHEVLESRAVFPSG
jgi:uncharacterized protein YciI